MSVKLGPLITCSLSSAQPRCRHTIHVTIRLTSSLSATASGCTLFSAYVAPTAATDKSSTAGVSEWRKVGLWSIGNVGWNFSKYKSTKSDKVSCSGKSPISGMSHRFWWERYMRDSIALRAVLLIASGTLGSRWGLGDALTPPSVRGRSGTFGLNMLGCH
jgi:hypothetical protein